MFNQVLNFNQNRTLNCSIPNMANTLSSWECPLTLIKITQDIVEGDVVTQEEKIDFLGVVQELSLEQLQFLPEGQRSWRHIWIHAKASTLNLQTGSKIIFNNDRFKILSVKNYSIYGFIEYLCIADYSSQV